jgi:small conductance mechanosensitive channel
MQGPVDFLVGTLVASAAPVAARVAGGLLVLFIAWRLAATAREWFTRVSARTKADVNHRVLVGRFVYFCVLVYGLIWGLEVFGVSPAALVTAVGVLGLAASLALQDILKNFCAGVYLLFERPFRIGDEIGVRDFRGRVVDIGIRTTSLHTSEDLQVLIPNAVVMAEVVVNRSTFSAGEGSVPSHETRG